MLVLSNANLETLNYTDLDQKGIKADVLRLDRLHPVVSGNKWYKLKYYLENAIAGKKKTLLTFGGAWSNHIIAAAYAARANNLHSVGIIRGERPPALSATLMAAKDYGMELVFVSRESFKLKQEDVSIKEIINRYPEACIIPEGAAGGPGIKGCGEILSLVPPGYYTHILCAAGTGTMYTGLSEAAAAGQVVIGIPVLKGMAGSDTFPDGYHFGGYAKKTTELLQFMNDFYRLTGIPTDFVYTGKLMYAFTDLIKKDRFKPGSRILLIHSGGLQGNTSLPAGSLEF